MALRLFYRNCKKSGNFNKAFKYVAMTNKSKVIPNQQYRSFYLHSESLKKLSNLITSKRMRSIHFSAVLCGKVVPFKLSDIGEGIVEVTIKEWYVKPGDKIAQFDSICEVQSDKASVTISSRYDGIVAKLYHEVEQMAKVGQPLIDIELEQNQESESDSESDEEVDSKVNDVSNTVSAQQLHLEKRLRVKALATPAVRKIAKENNINIQDIEGTGKDGRVLKEDILIHLDNLKASKSRPKAGQPSTLTSILETSSSLGVDKLEEITGFKKAMVKSMINAWSVPHFSYCDEVDIFDLVKMKDDMKRLSNSTGIKLTFMPFFIKAASLALLKYPLLNSHVDEKCQFLTMKAAHNIGVAMDTQNGLVVPNIKNVQNLSVIGVAKELNRLQELGARGQLGLEDLKDGTFTLSNIGSIGGTYTKPIIFSPQVVIGALGKIQVLPRFDKNKNVLEAHVFNISWSADHRVIDGATVAKFSNLWKAYLASPKLLLEL